MGKITKDEEHFLGIPVAHWPTVVSLDVPDVDIFS
jgi:hypothetical protein